MALQLPRRRFTVDEYHQMAEAGILAEDDRIELIEGEIIEMSPIGPRHFAEVIRLNEIFVRMFGEAVQVSPQNPIVLSEDTEPEPDLTLLRRRPDYYASGLPGSDDVFLVVEVADTSLAYDRRVKMALYARSGIPEYWLIDLNSETVTVYRDPGPEGYGTTRVARRGERLAPAAFPDRELTVEALLG
jgi:Uma2 family endonuclease